MSSGSQPLLQAAIFDLGGVVLGSPLEGIAEYEEKHGIPAGYVNVSIVTKGKEGAFQRLERGELSLDQFYQVFREELALPSQLQAYQNYRKRKGLEPLPASTTPPQIDTVALFDAMMQKSSKVNPDMVHALFILRCLGLKVAALTNNWNMDSAIESANPTNMENSSNTHAVSPYFDMVIESCVVGLRKPDPRIYELATNELNVTYNETVFLDDIGINLKSAAKLGIETIRVEIGKVREAIGKLEKVVRTRSPLASTTGVHENLFALSTSHAHVSRTYSVPVALPSKKETPGKTLRLVVSGHAANPPVVIVSDRDQDLSGAVRKVANKFLVVALGLFSDADPSDVAATLKRLGYGGRRPLVVQMGPASEHTATKVFEGLSPNASFATLEPNVLLGLEAPMQLSTVMEGHRLASQVCAVNPLAERFPREQMVTGSKL